MLLPYLVATAQFWYCKYYLLPRGKISEMHYYGEYEAFTMIESWALYFAGQWFTVILTISLLYTFYATVRTATYYDNDTSHQFIVIGSIPTSLGNILVGPHLYQKAVSWPKKYVNREGISFEDINGSETVAIAEYLHKKDYLFDWIFSKTPAMETIKQKLGGEITSEKNELEVE